MNSNFSEASIPDAPPRPPAVSRRIPRKPSVVALPNIERRFDNRAPLQGKAILTVLDASGANQTHEITTRDASFAGISFLLRESLSVGQKCRIKILGSGGSRSVTCAKSFAPACSAMAVMKWPSNSAKRFDRLVDSLPATRYIYHASGEMAERLKATVC